MGIRTAASKSPASIKYRRSQWTADQIAELIRLRTESRLWKDIAPRLRKSARACSEKYNKHVPKQDRIAVEGTPAASNFPTSVASSIKRKFRGRSPWTAGQTKRLIELRRGRLTWEEIAFQFPGKTPDGCSRHYYAVVPKQERISAEGSWTIAEGEELEGWHDQGLTWNEIAEKLPRRTPAACRDHYYLKRPGTRSAIWTEEETQILMKGVANRLKWKQIAERLPGRSISSCTQHYHVHKPRYDKHGSSSIQKHWKKWKPTDSKLLVDLRLAPDWKDWEEIVGRLERTQQSCIEKFSYIQKLAQNLANQSSIAEVLDSSSQPQFVKDILDKWGCRKCHRVAGNLADHQLFCNGDPVEDLVCIDCSKRFEDSSILIQHYEKAHSCDIREQGVENRWAELNAHLIPQLDLSSGYGSQLTRRPVVSGDGADPEIRQLWINFTNFPARLDGQHKKRLLVKYRAEFEGLFRATPVRFHAHVSDINPPSIHSLLQTLARSTGSSTQIRALKVSQEIPTFACTYGVYGAAYGQGASVSHIKEFDTNAAGKEYFEVMTADRNKQSVLSQLRKAKAQGCFALLTEVVRWMDGRVMPASEWAIIHQACRQLNMILIVDETLSLLRCGAPFAYQLEQYIGSPDLIFFGKGLVTSGVAIDLRGLWISKLKLDNQGMETADDEFSLVSDVLETGMLIRSMGIIRMARTEDWSSRGLRIGKVLLGFAKDLHKGTQELRVNGLGSLLYFNAEDVAHHGLQTAGAGRNKLRWIPVLDDIMQDPEKLRLKMFGPLSLAHRALVGRLMTKAGIFPSVCSACGHKSELGGDFCGRCCVLTCGPCVRRRKHMCILRVGTDP